VLSEDGKVRVEIINFISCVFVITLFIMTFPFCVVLVAASYYGSCSQADSFHDGE